MRTLLILAILCSLCCATLSAQWQKTETPFQPLIPAAIDSNTFWCLNLEAPKIARTTNGGLTWSQYDLPDSDGFLLSAFLSAFDSVNAWAGFKHYVSSDNFVYRTSDGGASWHLHNPPGLSSGQTIHFQKFYDVSTGIILSSDFNDHLFVHRTSTGGQTWTTQTFPISGAHLGTATFGTQNIWFYTSSGELWRSNDGGANWSKFQTGVIATSYGLEMAFSDNLHGLAFRDRYTHELYRTEDGGASWQPVGDNNLPPNVFVWGLSKIPGLPHAWMIGYNEGSAYSLDDGVTWISEINYPDEDFRKPEFLNRRQGWGIANSSSAVYKWQDPVDSLAVGCLEFTGPLTGKLRRSQCNQIWLEGSIPADISTDPGLHLRVRLSYPGHPNQSQSVHNLSTGCNDCTIHFVPDAGQTTTGILRFDIQVNFPYDTTQTILCSISPTLCANDTSNTYAFQTGYFANWFHPECFALDSSDCAIELQTNVCGNDTNQYLIYYRVQDQAAVIGTHYEKNPSYHELVQFYVFAYGDYQSSTCYEVFSTLYSCGVSGTDAPPVSEEVSLGIAPNPATESFQIFCDHLPEVPTNWIRIRNAAGIVVWSQPLPQGVPSLFIENQPLPAGFYVTELWSDDQLLKAKKLVIAGKSN